MGLALATLAIWCGLPDVPDSYHGHVGRVVFAIPSSVAFSVLYDGESDWKRPKRLRSMRTDSDPIQSIEFFIDLDRPDTIVEDQEGRELLSKRSDTPHYPDPFGHVLMVTARSMVGHEVEIDLLRKRMNIDPRLHAMKPSAPLYGLEVRAAEYGTPPRERDRHSLFNKDTELHDNTTATEIVCNDAWSQPPRQPMPTCDASIIDSETHMILSTTFDRIDLPRWAALRTSMLYTLETFKKR